MKNLDYNRRQSFLKYEIRRRALKSILMNQNLDNSIRWWAQIEKSKFSGRSCLSKIHNNCIETGRSRSVISFYKLSRIRLRKLASSGSLNGLSKSSW